MKLEKVAYNGPFELLFALIDKNEIDIYDIPISELTEQYLEYISSMEDMSEFILMAATLLEIKSKMLIPQPKSCSDEEEDPREDLVQRLLEYRRFKEMTAIFRDKEEEAQKHLFREPEYGSLELFFMDADKNTEIDDLLKDVTPEQLFDIFIDVLKRRELRTDKVRSGFNSVTRDSFTLEKKIKHISGLLSENKSILFSDVFSECATKLEKVITFLALLELIRRMQISVEQISNFDEINISVNPM